MVILAAALTSCVFVCRLMADPPAHPAPRFAAGQKMASLYIKSFSWQPTGLVLVEFVWIPSLIEPDCVTMTFDACQLFGQTRKDLKRGIPRQVLATKMTVDDQGLSSGITVLSDVSQLNLLPQTNRPEGVFSFVSVGDAPRVTAQVFWEAGVDGEIFRVLRIVKSTEPR